MIWVIVRPLDVNRVKKKKLIWNYTEHRWRKTYPHVTVNGKGIVSRVFDKK